MLGGITVCDRRNADGLRHLKLGLVQVVEFPGEIDVVDAGADRMVLDGPQCQPGLFCLTCSTFPRTGTVGKHSINAQRRY